MIAFRATYRLQLGPGFGFAAARELVPYLRDLGVSHLYLPPSFQARAGSEHGYDVVDPTRFSEELGGEREFDALAAAARRAGLGLILDIVPNHMATDDANRWWADPALRSRFFDIDEHTGRWRRFFDIDHLAAVRVRRTSRCSRRPTGWRCGWRARGRWTGCGSTIRTGSPTPPAICGACARGALATSGWRRSSTPESRCATGRSRGPSATSSSTTSRRCSSTRPARRR